MLFPADEKAYSTSEKPCGPGLKTACLASGMDSARAVPNSTARMGTSTIREAIFISKASIFLPRYSGVRPIISPATKTAMMTKASMPYSPEPTPP